MKRFSNTKSKTWGGVLALLIVVCVVASVSAQTVQTVVTGVVKDASGEPLMGVTVMLKGSRIGTTCDMNGSYTLRFSSSVVDPVLSFSFVGMVKQEIAVRSKTRIDVVMKEDAKVLGEVTIMGAYGMVQKRSDMVGSAYQIGAEKLEGLPTQRLDVMLEGQIPGLKISPESDAASSTRPRMNVRIRGGSSLSASNEPLWVVDGTPFYTGERTNQIPGVSGYSMSPLSFLNADDIASITVLKDASSTSIYGADGANGVILITTKQGQEGKMKVSVGARFGVAQVNESTKFRVLDADQYRELAYESYMNVAQNKKEFYPFQDNEMNSYSTTSTDWYDEFYGMGSTMQGNLSLRGGSKDVKYYVSGAYYQNELTVEGNKQTRISGRANLDIKMNRVMTLKINQGISYNTNDLFNPGTDYYDFLPIYSPINNDGSYRLYNTQVVQGENNQPVFKRMKFLNSIPEREEKNMTQRTFLSNTNALLSFNILKGLVFTSQFGLDFQSVYEDAYYARSNWGGMSLDGQSVGIARRNHVNFVNWANINRLNYNRILGVHQISALAGYELTSKVYRTVGSYGEGFVNDHIQEVSHAASSKGSSSQNTRRSMSMLAKVSYTYDNRYSFSADGRLDGNSSFGSDVRWGPFGSVGASWMINKEDFFVSETVSDLKLKLSFGTNGNSRIGSQEAMGKYSYNEGDNYAGVAGGSMSAAPNPSLSWERTYMTNGGVRLGLWRRFDLEIEGYYYKTVGLLSQLDVSRTTGDTRVYRNMGEISNRGVELTLSTINFEGPFTWTTDINAASNANRIDKLYNGNSKVMGDKIWMEGKDKDTYYLVRWAGVDPRDGSPLWYDRVGNIVRSWDEMNRVPLQTAEPLFSGGVTNSLAYRGFSLNVLFTYVIGGYSFSTFGRGVTSDGRDIGTENQSVNQLDRWRNPGDLVLSPKPYWGVTTGSSRNSTRFLYSTTHLKLKNMQLSYTLPKSVIKPLLIERCQLSLIVDNLGVWTPFDQKGRNSYRQNMSGFPMETMVSFGLDVSF